MAHSKGSTLIAKSVDEFISMFVEYPLAGFYARGEPKDYETSFLPSIWRKGHQFEDKTPLGDSTTFTQGELAALHKCQESVLSGQLTDDYFLKFIDDAKAEIDLKSHNLLHWAALAQHYNREQSHPTRLIDLTRDPLVALYFAVNKKPKNSGFVHYFTDNFNEVSDIENVKFRGTYFDIHEVRSPDGYPCHPNDDTLAIARTPFPNRRVEAQRGVFGWTRQIDIGCRRGGLIIEIPSDAKETVLEQLRRLNYDDYTLLPNDGICG